MSTQTHLRNFCFVIMLASSAPLVQSGWAADGQPAGIHASAEPKRMILEQAADGHVRLQASEATTHGMSVRYEPQPHKNTLGYWTNVNDWVSWEFRLTKPATFEVELTQSCSQANAGSHYTVTIGDATLRDTVPNTGTFTNFVQRIIGQVTLSKPGTYSVAVKPSTKPHFAVMDLRAIRLRPMK
jgi:arylsulfatase A